MPRGARLSRHARNGAGVLSLFLRMARGGMRAIRLAAVVFIATFVAAAGAALFALRSGAAHDWLAARVEAALGPRVRVAAVELTFWPPPLAVALHNVRIMPADAAPGAAPPAAPLAAAARVTVDLGVRDLLARQLTIDGLAIDQPVVTLERVADGTFRVAGLDALPSGGSADGADGALADIPPLQIDNGRLTLRAVAGDPASSMELSGIDGRFEPAADRLGFDISANAIDEAALHAKGSIGRLARPLDSLPIQATIELEHVDAAALARRLPLSDTSLQVRGTGRATLTVTGTGAAPTVDTRIELADGSVAWTEWQASAPLRASGRVSWTAAAGWSVANGQATATRLAHAGLEADALRAAFEYRNGVLALTGATLRTCGGTWEQTGRITVADPITVDATVRTAAVDAQQLAAALRTAGVPLPALHHAASIGLSASASGTVGGDLKGHAALTLALDSLEWNGMRLDPPLRAEADVALAHQTLRLSNGSATAQAVALAGVAVSDVDLRFSLADDVLRAEPVRARAASADWTVSGTVALDRAAAWHATVSATQVDLDALLAAVPGRDDGGPSSPGGVADIDATLGGSAAQAPNGQGTLRLHAGAFVLDELRVAAPAQLVTAFALRDGNLALQNASVQAARAAYGPLSGEQAAGRFALADDGLTLTDLRFASCGGSWTHTGNYALRAGGPFGGQITIDSADPQAVLAMLGMRDPALDLKRLDARADFHGAATPGWLNALNASGSLSVSGGAIRHGAVLTALWDALIQRPRSTSAATRENQIDRASATFMLADGVCHTQDLTLRSADYTLTGAGTVRLDGQLDLNTRITLSSTGVQHLLTLGALPLPTSGLPSLPPMPARITGPANDMIVRPDVSRVPTATAGWLVRSVVGAPAAVGGAVIDGVGTLFHGAERIMGRRGTPAPAARR